jgi:hypothetical protein
MVVKKSQRQRMLTFITELLEESPKYAILESKNQHIFVSKPEHHEKYAVLLHAGTKNETMKRIKKYCDELIQSNVRIAHVFYKDYENFFISTKTHHPKEKGGEQLESLKKYSQEQLNKMITLRDTEEFAILKNIRFYENQPHYDILTYYQPKTERLEESLRLFNLKPVFFDYSHLPEDKWPNKQERVKSIENRITEEIHNGHTYAVLGKINSHKAILLPADHLFKKTTN